MKKILFVVLALFLLFVAGCSDESSTGDSQDVGSDEQGYIGDMNQDFDNDDLSSMDEDLNLNWI